MRTEGKEGGGQGELQRWGEDNSKELSESDRGGEGMVREGKGEYKGQAK